MRINIQPTTNEISQPFRFIVTSGEFKAMKEEGFADVQNLTYEEYLEVEQECWREMFSSRFSKELALMSL